MVIPSKIKYMSTIVNLTRQLKIFFNNHMDYIFSNIDSISFIFHNIQSFKKEKEV